MPRLIEADSAEAIGLGELVEMLETGPFDGDDEDAFAHWGGALRKLGNDRRFLGDLIVEELKRHCAGQCAGNQYGPQVILLYGGSRRFLLRANLWPAADDSVVLNSGAAPFFYGLPHDHNFSFLTVGYLGPGYWSDYYEYDYDRVAGFTGEKVELRFVERSRLEEGRVLLYRRHRDIHLQRPPDALSVSLNILALSPATEFRDQYKFDIERSEISGIVNPSSLEALIMLAAGLGGGGGRDLVETFAERHPSERLRFAALKAKAGFEPDLDGRIAVYERAAGRSGGLVGAMAAREARRLEATRWWIEDSPGARGATEP
jgi:hypothetical protein